MHISILFLCFVVYSINAEDGIPALLGNSVTLECTIQQRDTLFWKSPDGTIIGMKGALFRGADPNKYFIQNSNTSISESLVIHHLTLADDGEYQCFESGRIQKFRVNILVRPTDFRRTGLSGPIEEGTQITLTCESDGGKPPPDTKWYLLGPNANRTELVAYNNDQQYSNGTWLRQSKLPLKVSRDLYKSSIICISSISYFYEVQQSFVLDVNLYPLAPVFSSFTGLFDDQTTQNIECHSYGSRPAANIYWILNGFRINGTARVSRDNNGTFTVSSTLTRTLTKAMEGQMLVCAVENAVLKNQNRPAIMTSVTLLANYAPTAISDNGTRTLTEGNGIIIKCNIDARPLPQKDDVIWLHDNSMPTGDKFNTTTEIRSISKLSTYLTISSISRTEIGHYQCIASNHLGSVRSLPLVLDVLYRPVCSHIGVEKHAAGIGQSLTLKCRFLANPANVSVNWKYTNRNIPMTNTQPIIKASDGSLYTMITIDIASAMQYTEVACIAANAVGEMLVPCLYSIVRPGPPEVPSNCSTTTVSDSSVRIQCTPGFNGGSQQQFALQLQDGTNFVNVMNESSPVFEVHDLTPSSNYTYRICAVTATYSTSTSCSVPVLALTSGTSGGAPVDSSVVQPTSSASTTPYIVGGVCGFIVLLCVVVIIIYCARKQKKASSSRNPRFSGGNGWVRETDSADIKITPGLRNSAFEEESVNSTKKVPNTESGASSSRSNSSVGKAKAKEECLDYNTKHNNDDNRITFMVYDNECDTKSNDYNTRERLDRINLAFANDVVTDLDELSHHGSPMPKSTGSPRHNFCYSETDILSAVKDDKEPEVDLGDTILLRKSKSHESLKDRSTTEDIKGDYINLTYSARDDSEDTGDNDKEIVTESSIDISSVDDQLKRSFVSQYTINLDYDNENTAKSTGNSTSSNYDSSSDHAERPRRNSYNMAISSDDDVDDKGILDDVIDIAYTKDQVSDVSITTAGCIVTDIDHLDTDDRSTHRDKKNLTDSSSSSSSSSDSESEAGNVNVEASFGKDCESTDTDLAGNVIVDIRRNIDKDKDYGEGNITSENQSVVSVEVDANIRLNNSSNDIFVAYF